MKCQTYFLGKIRTKLPKYPLLKVLPSMLRHLTLESHSSAGKVYQYKYFSYTRPRGYKTFFMLNSAEHEICPVNKSQITNNCKFFLAKHG